VVLLKLCSSSIGLSHACKTLQGKRNAGACKTIFAESNIPSLDLSHLWSRFPVHIGQVRSLSDSSAVSAAIEKMEAIKKNTNLTTIMNTAGSGLDEWAATPWKMPLHWQKNLRSGGHLAVLGRPCNRLQPGGGRFLSCLGNLALGGMNSSLVLRSYKNDK